MSYGPKQSEPRTGERVQRDPEFADPATLPVQIEGLSRQVDKLTHRVGELEGELQWIQSHVPIVELRMAPPFAPPDPDECPQGYATRYAPADHAVVESHTKKGGQNHPTPQTSRPAPPQGSDVPRPPNPPYNPNEVA